jgi:hypothetical protein
MAKKKSTAPTAAEPKAATKASKPAAAVGWLAREEKLEFAASGKTAKISLKS